MVKAQGVFTGDVDCSGVFSLSGGVASDDPVSAAHVALGAADQQRMAAALLRLQIHFQCFVQLLVVTEPLHLGFWLSSHGDTQLQQTLLLDRLRTKNPL